ncbi:uncharacterized mitochondrial protein-like protein [Tanacetum coccineum]
MEPKKPVQALKRDPSWVEAMQNELLQFKIEEDVLCPINLLFRKIPYFPDKVYKVEKALYGLHQAPRAWYETLSTYLLENGFHMGQIDKTLFIKRHKDDILLVQVKQKSDGIFISQDKYVAKILKKFHFASVKTASTPMETNKALIKDEEAEDVDVHLYRSMIGSLMYLTASRPDIMFAVCACASDYAGASLDRKSITGGFNTARQKITTARKMLMLFRRHGHQSCNCFQFLSLEALFEGRHIKRGRDTKIPQSSGPPDKGSGPRCQDTILGDVNAQTRFEITSKQSIDPPLSRGYTLGSGEDSMKLIGIDEIFPKFAETHNVVAFLEKPKESDGFAEIIDFLKASSVHYAFTVNPVIYTSCIEQFWATAKVQMVNGVRQLQALADKKWVIVTESSIRRDLHLDDAEGTDCLPTATIFEELARMGYEKPSQKLSFYKAFFSPQWKYFIHTITQCLSAKSTAWNEFSGSMASLIICLATNQKFNLSKYIFDAMVKHLDGEVKFLMYPRFLQVFINQQLGNMSTLKKIFVNPFHTKKVFANMKRAEKDFSRRITPLFDTMMEVPQDEAEHEESVPTPSNDPQPNGEDSMQLTDLMVLCTKLQTHALDLQKAKDAQAKEIAALKKRIQRLEKRKMSRPTGLKRLRTVGMSRRVESSED